MDAESEGTWKETVILVYKILSQDVFVGTGGSHEQINWPVSEGCLYPLSLEVRRQKSKAIL